MRYKVSGAIAIPKASWGCAPALPNRIQMVSLEAISKCFTWNISLQLFPRNSCKILVSRSSFTRLGGLVRTASKSCRFSHHPLRVPKAWHTDFAACGQRSELLALNLASIFEKLLDQKTFCFCAPHRWSNLFFILQIPHTFGSHSALFHVKQCSWKNNCVRFSRIASLSACVLFAGGCVVRIGYESFLDFGFSEFFMPSEWRTAVHFVSLRSLLLLIIHSLQGAACPQCH